MHAIFIAVAVCVMTGLIEAQMDRREQQRAEGVRTRAQRQRDEEEARRREQMDPRRREQEDERRRQQEDSRRRREEDRQRRDQTMRQIQRRVGELPILEGRLEALDELDPAVRPVFQELIDELQHRQRAAQMSQPEE